ncbi:acyltransferase [Nocardioides sp.]|uniref:acyltransferase family protein n=1 Tax=Nocardioides sp. TaxID=35761 RepID=UPI002725DE4B|nr:acyltransferase [Nocardioides sp.]MDO9454973.1 acyltransferase [Nocardioides sp.]
MAATSQNRAIDAIRFLAALLVVLGHVRLTMFEDYPTASHGPLSQALYAVTGMGAPAVLVFFALSGYWVGGFGVVNRVRAGRFDVRDYAIARLTRLWIVLLPALALTAVVDWVGRKAFSSSDLYQVPVPYTGIEEVPSHALSTLAGNVVFVQEIHVKPFGYNYPLWSLSYEFWFYVIFAALALATSRQRGTTTRVVAVVVALLGCVVAGTDVLQLSLAWLFGVAAAVLAPQARRWAARSSSTMGWSQLAAAGVTGIAMVVARQLDLQGAPVAVVVGLPAAVLLWTLTDDLAWTGVKGRLLGVFEAGSRSSYSLYAIHMPIVVLLAAWLTPTREERWTLGPVGFVEVLVITGGLIVIAVGFAAVTERRTHDVRRLLGRATAPRVGA